MPLAISPTRFQLLTAIIPASGGDRIAAYATLKRAILCVKMRCRAVEAGSRRCHRHLMTHRVMTGGLRARVALASG